MAVAGLLVLVWILVFTASDVSGTDVAYQVDMDHLDQQSWGLYAPDPSEAYSWYLVEGELGNGTTIDAFAGGNLSFDRPPDASKTYATFRHRKYMQKVRDSGRADTSNIIAKRYADWACDRANERRDERVQQITVYRMYQPSPIDGEYERPRTITVIERYCGPFETPPDDGNWGSFNESDSRNSSESLPDDRPVLGPDGARNSSRGR